MKDFFKKMQNLTLLAIDDDPLVLEAIKLINPPGWNIITSLTPPDKPVSPFDAAIVDVHLEGDTSNRSGLKVIESLKNQNPHADIIAMSGDLKRDLMEAALISGAIRFVAKPLASNELISLLDKIKAHRELTQVRNRYKKLATQWLGTSKASNDIRKNIAQLKGEPGPILIEGESGTGKEVVAQLLNQQEGDRSWLSLNMASLPENLFESELFGHVKGAFTGADQDKMGLIEAANNGDLFLDEIEALPMTLQPKLLRFLETGEIRRVGGKQNLYVRVRVIAATNERLEEKIQKGNFREDLYYRLSGKKISIPPLRSRKEDILELTKAFLAQDVKRKFQLSEDALKELETHFWPGNVRELKRIIEQVTLSAPMPILRAEDFAPLLRKREALNSSNQKINLNEGLEKLLENYERELLRLSTEQFQSPDDASTALKISRSSYYAKLKSYGIGGKLR
jgi:DNA-binding NtrC family response regulator